jgi:TonB family protein
MLVALLLLLGSLTLVLYRDRDFWFPDTEEADSLPPSPADVPRSASTEPSAVAPNPPREQKEKKAQLRKPLQRDAQVINDPPVAGPTVTATRTVLPPLEVEVVAGDSHRRLHPGSNAVHVELERPRQSQGSSAFVRDSNESAAGATTPAAQRTNVTSDAATSIVMRSVQPEYPMLARQMRVQGSVILQALIGRDGLIQDLRVVSGPPILANAAQEAVRQWHFKPHFLGAQPVETRANITVNFTISTN